MASPSMSWFRRPSRVTFNTTDFTERPFVNNSIEDRVRLAVAAALDKKATNLDVLAVGGLTSIADYFVLCSAGNERQAQAIADSIVDRLRQDMNVKPLLVEGTTPGRWVLLDFGDFIVHIFTEDVRRFYGLERLWGDAPNVTAEYTGEAEARAFKKTS
jgi:ribosome-associated protein